MTERKRRRKSLCVCRASKQIATASAASSRRCTSANNKSRAVYTGCSARPDRAPDATRHTARARAANRDLGSSISSNLGHGGRAVDLPFTKCSLPLRVCIRRPRATDSCHLRARGYKSRVERTRRRERTAGPFVRTTITTTMLFRSLSKVRSRFSKST